MEVAGIVIGIAVIAVFLWQMRDRQPPVTSHVFVSVDWMRGCGHSVHPQDDRCGRSAQDHKPDLEG